MKGSTIFILALALILTSCGGGPKQLTRGKWIDPSVQDMSPSVYLMRVDDGQERNGEVSYGSGDYVQLELVAALEARSISSLGTQEHDKAAALEEAKNTNYKYLMIAKIVEWENNATEWSGNPDAASISVELFSVESETIVANSNSRKRGTYSSIGPAKPDRFVPFIVNEIVENLFSYLD